MGEGEGEEANTYDVLVVGTGLSECILAAALARSGQKVLHIDHDKYYGGEFRTYSLVELMAWLNNTLEKNCNDPPLLKYTSPFFNTTYDIHSPLEDEVSGRDDQKVYDLNSRPSNISNTRSDGSCMQDSVNNIIYPVTTNRVNEPNTEQQACTINTTKDGCVVKAKTKTETWKAMLKLSRKFNIDLKPKLIFANGPLVKLLISSAVGRYLEFRCLEATFIESNGELKSVPCSKADIFTSKAVNLIEKRMLMRFLTFAFECHLAQNVEVWREYENEPFTVFLKKQQKLSKNVQRFIIFAIVLYDNDVFGESDGALKLTTKQGLQLTKRYLNSLGKFGKTCYLLSPYGISEIAQAFSRLCAVFGGTTMLNTCVLRLNSDLNCKEGAAVSPNENGNTSGNFETLLKLPDESEEVFYSKHVAMSPCYNLSSVPTETNNPNPIQEPKKTALKYHSHGILITNKNLHLSHNNNGDDVKDDHVEVSSIIFPAGTVVGENGFKLKHSISMTQHSSKSLVTPEGYYLIYMTCVSTDMVQPSSKDDLLPLVNEYFNIANANTDTSTSVNGKPQVYFSCFYNEKLYLDVVNTDLPGTHIFAVGGGDDKNDFDLVINKAKQAFSKICPQEEFLPKAPDPEDIVTE